MSLLKHMYILMTVVIASLFLSMFVTGIVMYKENWWWCLIPVVIVVSDAIRLFRKHGLEIVVEDRTPDVMIFRSEPMEFIKEEEFKV